MSQRYPETESTEAADQGTYVHDLAGEYLLGTPIPEDTNIEAKSAITMYSQDVHSVTPTPTVEEKLAIPRIHDLLFGTVDCYHFDKATGTLYIWDFKYGHSLVEVFENLQLLCYVAGILGKLNLWDQDVTVVMRIVQPRAFHEDGSIRQWKVKASALRPYFNQLRNYAEASLQDDAECRSGSHCLNCQARHACPTALKAGLSMYEAVGKTTPVELTPEALGVQLAMVIRATEALKTLKTGYEAQVDSLMRNHVTVPGFRMAFGRGKLAWSEEAFMVEAMGTQVGIDLVKERKLLTPTQALDAGVNADLVKAWSKRTPGRPVLTQDKESRAREVFNITLTEEKGEQ